MDWQIRDHVYIDQPGWVLEYIGNFRWRYFPQMCIFIGSFQIVCDIGYLAIVPSARCRPLLQPSKPARHALYPLRYDGAQFDGPTLSLEMWVGETVTKILNVNVNTCYLSIKPRDDE